MLFKRLFVRECLKTKVFQIALCLQGLPSEIAASKTSDSGFPKYKFIIHLVPQPLALPLRVLCLLVKPWNKEIDPEMSLMRPPRPMLPLLLYGKWTCNDCHRRLPCSENGYTLYTHPSACTGKDRAWSVKYRALTHTRK